MAGAGYLKKDLIIDSRSTIAICARDENYNCIQGLVRSWHHDSKPRFQEVIIRSWGN
jgi:hypothetical protein